MKRGKLMRRTPINRRSEKRQKQMAEVRIPMVEAHLEGGCQMCPALHELGIAVRCGGRISGMHERRKSSSGGSRENPANLIPACSWGNGYVEDAVGRDRELIEASRLVVREGDPEWERLGTRWWRDHG